MCVGSLTAATWSSSQSLPDLEEFETDRHVRMQSAAELKAIPFMDATAMAVVVTPPARLAQASIALWDITGLKHSTAKKSAA